MALTKLQKKLKKQTNKELTNRLKTAARMTDSLGADRAVNEGANSVVDILDSLKIGNNSYRDKRFNIEDQTLDEKHVTLDERLDEFPDPPKTPENLKDLLLNYGWGGGGGLSKFDDLEDLLHNEGILGLGGTSKFDGLRDLLLDEGILGGGGVSKFPWLRDKFKDGNKKTENKNIVIGKPLESIAERAKKLHNLKREFESDRKLKEAKDHLDKMKLMEKIEFDEIKRREWKTIKGESI